MRGVTAAWLAMVAAATYKWQTDPANAGESMPPPSIYVGTAVVYSLLGLAAGPAPGPATAMGWALVVAALTTGVLLPKSGPVTQAQAGINPGRNVAGTHQSASGNHGRTPVSGGRGGV